MDYQEALKKAIEEANKQLDMQAYSGENAYNDIQQKNALAEQYERQRLSERLSNAGGSNVPLTIQNRDQMASKNVQGTITGSGQNYTQYLNNMVSQANASGDARAAGYTADFNTAENASAMNTEMNNLERYYNLFMNGKMTSSMFKKKTGINVNVYKKKKKGIESFEDLMNWAVDNNIIGANDAAQAVRGGSDYFVNRVLDEIVNSDKMGK